MGSWLTLLRSCAPSQTRSPAETHMQTWVGPTLTSFTRLLPDPFSQAAQSCDYLHLVWNCLSSLRSSITPLSCQQYSPATAPRPQCWQTRKLPLLPCRLPSPSLSPFLSGAYNNLCSGYSHPRTGPWIFVFLPASDLRWTLLFYLLLHTLKHLVWNRVLKQKAVFNKAIILVKFLRYYIQKAKWFNPHFD